MDIHDFENIFGNVPFKDIKKIQKYIQDNFISKEKIKEKVEKNKARTDCRYCNNTCDSYAVCMFCKELLEGK